MIQFHNAIAFAIQTVRFSNPRIIPILSRVRFFFREIVDGLLQVHFVGWSVLHPGMLWVPIERNVPMNSLEFGVEMDFQTKRRSGPDGTDRVRSSSIIGLAVFIIPMCKRRESGVFCIRFLV